MATSHVVMVEPFCRGDEHAQVNAALIATVRCSFPSDRIEFWAEECHLLEVRNVLQSTSVDCDPRTVVWKQLQPVDRSSAFWLRSVAGRKMVADALRRSQALQARCCLFTAFDDALLMASRTLTTREVPAVAVFHSAMASLSNPPSRAPWRRLVSLKSLLERGGSTGIHVVVLGSSILKEVLALAPNADVSAVEHPYIWQHHIVPDPPRGVVRFGSFGGLWKGGVDALLQLKQHVPSAAFAVIGRADANSVLRLRQAGCEVSADRLSLHEYRNRALSVNYALWIADAAPYRLTASGSFLDSLSYVRPGLFLRNPYVEACFDKLGDIGYLCDSVHEVSEIVKEIAANPPAERYMAQCRNILNGRRLFAPSSVAVDLSAIVDRLRLRSPQPLP